MGDGIAVITGSSLALLNTDVIIGVDSGGSLTIASQITGDQGFVKVGAGTLELAGTIANTYTGETTVTLGTLLLNSGALNGAIPRALTIGDPLGAVGAASVVLQQSSQIANAIPVTIRRGLLDLNGRTEQVNGLILSEGQVNSRTGLLEVTGNISSVAGTLPSTIAGRLDLRTATRTFTVDRGSATVDLEIDSTVANGGIVKNGTGRMLLTATNTYSGLTLLNAGILEIDGVQRNSPVTVAGGTLGGSGVIGTLTGTGGVINPGSDNVVGPDSLETLSVGLGAATYAPDLMFNTALGLPGSDELVVTGSVDVTGATLAPILTNTPLIGNRFTIIENDGSDPVIGTFNGRPEGAIFPVGGTTFQITYKGGDGNDVVVTVLTALPGNTPPTISNILDQASTGAAVGPLPFTIADAETPVGNLQTTAASSNQIVVPDSGIIIIGNGASRTITLTPAAGQAGTTTITVTVTDGNGATASDTFVVTISPPPPPPPAVSASPILVGGATNGSVGVFNPTNPSTATYSAGNSVSPFGGIASNVRVATGDVNGDGVRDFIVVTGPGVPIQLAVINGKDNSILVAPFDPFPPALGGAPFTGGGFVSSADMDKKIGDEFAVSPDITGGPRVTIYSLVNGTLSTRANFFAVDPDFRGGARIAIGDANGDGFGDLMIGAGFGGGPRVQLLDGTKAINGFPAQPLQTDKLINDFFAFDSNLRDGSFLAIGDVNGDGSNELIFGAGDGGPLQVVVVTAKQFLSDGSLANPIARFSPTGLGGDGSGARVAVASTGNGSQVNVVVGTGKRALGVAKVYPGTSFTNGMTTEPAGGKVLVNSSILVDGIYVG